MESGKIHSLEVLAEIATRLRQENRRIVLCHGCFDLLHIGHIRYLREAKQKGDVLFVTLTADEHVDKGPHRPAFPENLRAEGVASLDCVDYAAVNRWSTAEETLRLLRPHVYVKGSDFNGIQSDATGKLAKEAQVARELGIEIAFTEDIVFSSTHLINRFFSTFPEDVQQYLQVFRTRYRLEDLMDLLERMSELRVLVIGDTILDDYIFCHTMGSSSKDPVLAVQYVANDIFVGGVLAVANHIANFAREVRLVTVVGDRDNHENFIRSKLRPNVSPYIIIQDGAPTTIKRRFVDGYYLNKLFEVYVMDDSGLSAEKDRRLCGLLHSELPEYDVIVAADFGHGAISKNIVKILMDRASYLAVNTQANTGNRGLHTVTRYARADYVSLAEHEIRLEMRDARGDLRPMMEQMRARLGCEKFVVTRGKKGCLIVDRQGGIVEVPAFAQKVVDRIGAGDAFLSITALAAYLQASAELIGFVGNIVGALAVGIVGNQKAIDKDSVEKFITSLMK